MPKKSRLYREISDQIDKTSPERKLGNVSIISPKVLRFQPREEIDNPQGISFEWQKRSFIFDRGDLEEIDLEEFHNFTGKVNYSIINSDQGNFIDDGLDPAINIHYAVEIFSDKVRDVKVEVISSLSSVAMYVNNIRVFGSGTDFFQTGNRTFSLIAGYNRLDIFYYRKSSDGFLKVDGDLGQFVSSWRPIDFTPPSTVQWKDTDPIITEYVDPKDFGQFHNVLRWKKFPIGSEDQVAIQDNDIFAYEMYRNTKKPIKNLSEADVLVVSGFGTYGFATSGDLRYIIPKQSNIYLGTAENEYIVSGTSFNTSLNQTIVNISGAFIGSDPTANDPLQIDEYRRIFGYPFDPTLPFIISGIDQFVEHNETYKYFILTRDRAFGGNRSERSEIKTILTGDFTAPGHVTNLNNVRIFNTVVLTFNIPTDNDLAGFKVYEGSVSDTNLVKTVSIKNTAIPGTSFFSIGIENDGSNNLLSAGTQYTFFVTPFDYRNNENITAPPSTTSTFGTILGGQSSYDTGTGFFIGHDGTNFVVSIGDGSTQTIRFDGTTLVASGAVIDNIAANSDPAIQSWQYDTDFYSIDNDTVGWGAGTFTLHDGTAYSIISGTTGNMSIFTYVYFDKNTSQTAFQTTTTPSTSVGTGKLLIVSAKDISDSNKKAVFQQHGGQGNQSSFIFKENIASKTITAGEINVNQLSALAIDAGDITAGNLTGLTVTGGVIQTAVSGQRIIISGADNTFRMWDSSDNQLILIDDDAFVSSPGIVLGKGIVACLPDYIDKLNLAYTLQSSSQFLAINGLNTQKNNKAFQVLISSSASSTPTAFFAETTQTDGYLLDLIATAGSDKRFRLSDLGVFSLDNITTLAEDVSTQDLLISGSFQLTTSPTNNHVLTSDANGVGTWQVAAGGWIDDGTEVRLTTSTDNVGIGMIPSSGDKLVISGGDMVVSGTQSAILRVSNTNNSVNIDSTSETLAKGITETTYYIKTANTTETTLASITLDTGSSNHIIAKITYIDENDDANMYTIQGGFKNIQGTVTQVGTTNTAGLNVEEAAGASVLFDISGTSVRVRVIGVVGDVNWQAVVRIITQLLG